MKKILKKLSIRDQIVLIAFLLLFASVILYVLYVNLFKNTNFFLNHPILFNILYWTIIFIADIGLLAYFTDKITDSIQVTIGYIKEFNEINFKVVLEESLNSDTYYITEGLMHLQEKVFQNIEELKQKNSEVLRLIEEQEKDYQDKKNLVTSLSHDLKTPLTVIYTTISAIQDGIFTDNQVTEELNNVLKEIDSTILMLQDVISIFKMDAEIKQINKEEFGLVEIINKTTDNLQKLFVKYQQELIINMPSDIKIYADKKQFERVLDNLIVNALVHSPAKNTITINLSSNDTSDTLEIINTGVTIAEEDKEHIFEPFYQADKSRNKLIDHGNGLGLYIAKEICKKNNVTLGFINLDNAVKFYLVLQKDIK